MSEWITDRRPVPEDGDVHDCVWVCDADGDVYQLLYNYVLDEPWMPITPPKPCVEPHTYTLLPHLDGSSYWRVTRKGFGHVLAQFIPEKESAERIAKIFREMMP